MMTKTREILVKACTLKPGEVVLGPNGWVKISRLCMTSEKVEIQPGDFSRDSDYDIWVRRG